MVINRVEITLFCVFMNIVRFKTSSYRAINPSRAVVCPLGDGVTVKCCAEWEIIGPLRKHRRRSLTDPRGGRRRGCDYLPEMPRRSGGRRPFRASLSAAIISVSPARRANSFAKPNGGFGSNTHTTHTVAYQNKGAPR